MKVFLALFLALLLTACTDPPPDITVSYSIQRHCTTLEERQALAAFVVDCSRAANPKSDEEGEDLVAQCQGTAEKILCPEHRHRYTTRKNGHVTVMADVEEVESFTQPRRAEQVKTP